MMKSLSHILAKVFFLKPNTEIKSQTTPPPSNKLVLLSGILPLIVYTLVEEIYGTYWGLIAGLILGISEIIFEKILYKKVSTVTWVVNAMVISLGAVSLYMNDGIWFKLQPAFAELVMVLLLWGSTIMKRPFLREMAAKQMPNTPEHMLVFFESITFRLGLFFLIHSVLAVWAAFEWSTVNWALLKGVGLTVSTVLYLVAEMWFFLNRTKRRQ